MQILKADTQVVVRIGPFVDSIDGVTPETGVTLGAADQAELLKHNGAVTADISASTWSAITGCGGWYDLTITTGNTDTEGLLTVVVQDSSVCLPVFAHFMVVNANVYDSLYAAAATDYLQVDVLQISGDAQSATDLKDFADAGYDPATNKVQGVVLTDTCTALTGNTAQTGDSFARLGAPAGVSVSVDIAAIEAQTDDIGTAGAGLTAIASVGAVAGAVGSVTGNVGGNVVGSVASVTGAVGSVTGAVGSVTAGVTVTTNNDKTGYGLSAAAVQAIWDALTVALTTVGSIGKKLADWTVGTIDTYTGNTKQTGDSYARLGAPAGASVSADIAAIEAQTDDIGAAGAGLTALPWNATWDAEVQSECADALTAYDAATGTDVTTAHATTDGLVTAVDNFVDTEVTAIKTVTDKLDTAMELDGAVYRYTTNALEQAPSGGATAAAVADAVWDETAADHVAAGSMGKKLNDVVGGTAVNIDHDSTAIVRE